MKTIKLTLKQNDAILNFNASIDSEKITELSGTISRNVLKTFEMKRKYKMDFGGFSFFRKFKVSIDVEGLTFENDLIKHLTSFDLTLSEKSFSRFIDFINELMTQLLTGEYSTIVDVEELKQEYKLT